MKTAFDNSKFLEILSSIKKSDKIVIVSHENPDGDSAGSSLALRDYCISCGKQANVIFHNHLPDDLDFLPNKDKILVYSELPDDSLLENADLLLIVDVNSINRLASVGRAFNAAQCRKIMLDHHRDPEDIADFYYCDPNAAAAGEIVWKLIKCDPEYKMNRDTAICLYTAILTDTGGFQFGNTTSITHEMAAELLQHDIHATEIYDRTYNSMPRNIFILLGRTFAGSKIYFDGKVNVMKVTRKDLNELNVLPENLNNFPEKTLTIAGAEIGIMMTEMVKRDGVKVSFRSKGEIDIRQIAAYFGGGGHRNAAGAKIYNIPMDIVLKQIIEKISKIL